jgi:hypothetical protein
VGRTAWVAGRPHWTPHHAAPGRTGFVPLESIHDFRTSTRRGSSWHRGRSRGRACRDSSRRPRKRCSATW